MISAEHQRRRHYHRRIWTDRERTIRHDLQRDAISLASASIIGLSTLESVIQTLSFLRCRLTTPSKINRQQEGFRLLPRFTR